MCTNITSSCITLQMFLIWNWPTLCKSLGHRLRTVALLAEVKTTVPTLLHHCHLLNFSHYKAKAFLPMILPKHEKLCRLLWSSAAAGTTSSLSLFKCNWSFKIRFFMVKTETVEKALCLNRNQQSRTWGKHWTSKELQNLKSYILFNPGLILLLLKEPNPQEMSAQAGLGCSALSPCPLPERIAAVMGWPGTPAVSRKHSQKAEVRPGITETVCFPTDSF